MSLSDGIFSENNPFWDQLLSMQLTIITARAGEYFMTSLTVQSKGWPTGAEPSSPTPSEAVTRHRKHMPELPGSLESLQAATTSLETTQKEM